MISPFIIIWSSFTYKAIKLYYYFDFMESKEYIEMWKWVINSSLSLVYAFI